MIRPGSNRARGRRLGPRLVLALAAILLAWAAFEAVMRLWEGRPESYGGRVLFFSRDNWQIDDTGAPRYVPDSTIRAVSLYGTYAEFDVTFQTNNLGYVDSEDYPLPPPVGAGDDPDIRRIALVGDSFTAGFHGGDPWVPRLRRRSAEEGRGALVYNFGVGATGLAQFGSILRSAARRVPFDEVAVLFISADLYRPPWYHFQTANEIYICAPHVSEERCSSRVSRIRIAPDAATPLDELVAIARDAGLMPDDTSVAGWLRENTFAGSRWARFEAARASVEWRAMRDWPREWLSRLREDFPELPIVFVQLPEKSEVIHDVLRVEPMEELRHAGIDYVSLLEVCDLEERDYFRVDAHPTHAGYEKILRCVGEVLELFPAPRASGSGVASAFSEPAATTAESATGSPRRAGR